MNLLRLFRLVESSDVAKFYILRLDGKETLHRANEDFRFFMKRRGVDPRTMRPQVIDDNDPHGPNVRTIRTWEFQDGLSALIEVEMPSQATGIRTGKIVGSKSAFVRGQNYTIDQIGAGFREEAKNRISYAVGPGLDAPSDVIPSKWPSSEPFDSMDTNIDLEND